MIVVRPKVYQIFHYINDLTKINGNLRSVEINDEKYFCGNDVAQLMGYKRAADAISAHVSETYKKSLESVLKQARFRIDFRGPERIVQLIQENRAQARLYEAIFGLAVCDQGQQC